MTLRSTFLSIASLTIACTAAVAPAAPQDTKTAPPPSKERDKAAQQDKTKGQAKTEGTAKVGEKAPEFSLTDAAGKAYKLSDYTGKVVVLQWINPDCPVCKRVSSTGLVSKMLTEIKKTDPTVVHLMVNSTHYMEPAGTTAYLKDNKIESPGLIDRDGKVGNLYGAKTTPHVFVIDKDGILRYQGAFDDDARGAKTEGVTNYVAQAVRQITAGETVTPDTTRPYGCSVKFAPAKESGLGTGG